MPLGFTLKLLLFDEDDDGGTKGGSSGDYKGVVEGIQHKNEGGGLPSSGVFSTQKIFKIISAVMSYVWFLT